ncbi:hypothetical protein HDU85_007463 [Gaertneriomyces sp. JEL0708]|nr:hypothetical protein HDU85_007463 [Gaertneriomyces sp. JEL0708]
MNNAIPTLPVLIEDDEFSEFPLSDWTPDESNTEDARLWEDQWEDEDLWDEFTMQLREELTKPTLQQPQPPQPQPPQQQQQQQQT